MTALRTIDQRYYASTYGRFNTADPYRGSARARNPLTWNRYSYVGGDPINRSDPRGLVWYDNGDGQWCSDVSGVCSDIDCTENPTACADALGEDDEGFGGGGGSAYLTDTFISTEITTTETIPGLTVRTLSCSGWGEGVEEAVVGQVAEVR
jgi:RHS repeat-associated protein